MTGQARRHHVVSKFYLRYFADEREQIRTVPLPGDRSYLQSINNASVRNDFYTVVDHAGQNSDAVEREAFGLIEGAAAESWRLVDADVWPLPPDHRNNMAAWIGLQLLRGTRVRNAMSQIGTHGMLMEAVVGGRRRIREALVDSGMPCDDAVVDEHWVSIFRDPLEVRVHANHHVQHVGHALPEVVQTVRDRWWVLTVFERKRLATSDHPAYVVPNERSTRVGMGTGIVNADVIHVPLTRRHSLAMALRPSLPPELASMVEDWREPGSASTALYSNSCTVNSAREFIFHHPADRPLSGLTIPAPRTREVAASVDLWSWIPNDDRQVLIDSGLGPEDVQRLLA